MAGSLDACISILKGLIKKSDTGLNIESPDVQLEVSQFKAKFIEEMSEVMFGGLYLQDDFPQELRKLYELFSSWENGVFPAQVQFVQSFQRLIERIRRKQHPEKTPLLLNLVWEDSSALRRESDDYRNWHVSSLRLLDIDHFLVANRDIVERLVIIYESLSRSDSVDNPKLQDIFSCLKGKCAFLLRKTMLYQENKFELYMFFDEQKRLKDIIEADEKCKDFREYFNSIYYLEEGESPKHRFSERHKDGSKARILAMQACYYAVQKQESPVLIEDLLKRFDDWESSYRPRCEYDRRAVLTVKDYIYNCYLSLKLEEVDDLETLRGLYNEVCVVQEKSGVWNYHPYKRLLETFAPIFNKCAETLEPISPSYQKLYSSLFEKYVSNYKVCAAESFIPFQLPINDCKTCDGIFIASSVACPISPASLKQSEEQFRATDAGYGKIDPSSAKRKEIDGQT